MCTMDKMNFYYSSMCMMDKIPKDTMLATYDWKRLHESANMGWVPCIREKHLVPTLYHGMCALRLI
jgi:hypothetical protein